MLLIECLHVLTSPSQSDKQSWGIKRFNDYITADSRIEKVILPMRDGLTVIRKL